MVSPIERVTRIQKTDERTHNKDLPVDPPHAPESDEDKLITEVGISHLPKKMRRVKLKKGIKRLKKSPLPDFNEDLF